MALLELRNVTVLRGAIAVVRDVTLAVERGDSVALMGRNGCGRTTLLAGLAGLLPLTGAVSFDGSDLAPQAPRAALRAGVALCPEGRALFQDLTVWENLLLGGYLLPRHAAEGRAAAIATRVPLLAERRRQRAGSLSGGEQQILAVARACMSQPRLLLLDQPTTGQAPGFRAQVAALAREVLERGGALLMAEDDLDFALSLATRVVALSGGRVAFELPVRPDLDRTRLLESLLSWELRGASAEPGRVAEPAANAAALGERSW